jgi:hypothetical protein
MLAKKYRWAYNGQYPNYWVQPVYPNGSLSDNASQQVYIDQLAAANITVNDTNKPGVYRDNIRQCLNSLPVCRNRDIRQLTYNNISAQGYYTKTLHIPQESSQYTLQVQRKCSNPVGAQKPFPFATSMPGVSVSASSIGANPGPPPPIGTEVYLEPPEWYIQMGNKCS